MRFLLSLAVAAALLALLVAWGGVSVAELLETARGLSLSTYGAALGVHAGIYLLRAVRFRQLVPPPARPALSRVIAASAAHNLAAYVLPAKTGEAALVLYLRGSASLAAAPALATLVVSRLLDLATLAGSIGAASLTLALTAPGGARAWMLPAGLVLLAGALGFGFLCASSDRLVRLVAHLARLAGAERRSLGRRCLARVDEVAGALRLAGADGRLGRAALLSLPLWTGVFVFYALLARDLGLAPYADLARAVFGSGLATAFNLLPVNGLAGFGTQEAGWVAGFMLVGAPRDIALAAGIGAHLVQLWNVALFGLAGHVAMGLLPRPARSLDGGE